MRKIQSFPTLEYFNHVLFETPSVLLPQLQRPSENKTIVLLSIVKIYYYLKQGVEILLHVSARSVSTEDILVMIARVGMMQPSLLSC